MSGFLSTALSCVDGARGVLLVRGVALEDLVRLPFPQAAALVLEDDVTRGVDVGVRLVRRSLGANLRRMAVALAHRPAMARLRALTAALDDEDDDVAFAGLCGRLVALLGPRPDDAHDADDYVRAVLRGASGGAVDDDDVLDLGCCFICHVDHALNPGTLAARVAASTGASLSACIGAGLAALEGPLHGGASSEVGRVLAELSSPAEVDGFLAARAAAKRRIPGFGHPIYEHRDPRAAVLRALCERAARRRGDHRFFDVAVAIDERLSARSGGRLFPNVDFYAAALYATLGVPLALHTPMFFAARVIGWLAHVREQRARGRIISPESDYDGPARRAL